MIVLIKSFSLQKVGLVNSLGGNKVASSFSLQNVALINSLGGNKVASSFALARGGYTIDGNIVLPNDVDDGKIIRVK